jgi:hypothetical protein
MQSALPLDVLADELGAAAGRIERELRLKDEARAARFEARLAAIELAAFKAEEERQRIFGERLAGLRNGRDGDPGKDGKDADIEPLIKRVQVAEELSVQHIGLLSKELTDKVDAKLAEVKDGEPGRDGKDADISQLEHRYRQLDDVITSHMGMLNKELTTKVNAKLAEVKDGEPGKDGETPDVELAKQEIFNKVKAQVNHAFEAFQKNIEIKVAQVDAVLAEVKDGKDGEPGPEGPPGKDGKLPIAREWTNRVHYEGDVVRHNGATYQALTDTGQQPPHSDWGELASRGTDGRGFVLRGLYNATAEYRQHDIVMINRNSFAAKYDNPGECPGEGWQLFACSGYKGKEGPPGPAGAKGADGRSVSIVKWEADPDEMVLRIADSTGNTFAVDLQPIAERIVEAAR